MSEIVAALLEINFKATDVSSVVKLCLNLHCRYEDFTVPLLTGIRESVLRPLSANNEDIIRQKRLQIRLLIEFYQYGLFNDADYFVNLLRSILGKNKK